jgi:regulator of protease activity HflC (stomatin/prohibitin superfamily)
VHGRFLPRQLKHSCSIGYEISDPLDIAIRHCPDRVKGDSGSLSRPGSGNDRPLSIVYILRVANLKPEQGEITMFLIEAAIMVAAVVLGVAFVARNGIRWRRDRDGGISSIEGVNVSAFGVGILFVIAGGVLVSSFAVVPSGFRGVVLRFDAVTGRILEEGINVKMPFIDTVRLADVQLQRNDYPSLAASRDLQEVSTTVTVNWRRSPEAVVDSYQDRRFQEDARILPNAVAEAVKAATAQYAAEDLIIQRAAVKADIQDTLTTRLGGFGMLVDDVQITDFDFSDVFNNSLAAKVVAEQAALEEQNRLVQVQAQADQRVVRATAEAEELRLKRLEVTAELIELRRIELQQLALEQWNGVMPQYITEGSPVPVIDLFR